MCVIIVSTAFSGLSPWSNNQQQCQRKKHIGQIRRPEETSGPFGGPRAALDHHEEHQVEVCQDGPRARGPRHLRSGLLLQVLLQAVSKAFHGEHSLSLIGPLTIVLCIIAGQGPQ